MPPSSYSSRRQATETARSGPLTLSIPSPTPTPVKKTTVDVIISKIRYDTVIPVDIMANAAAFRAKCKPYDIIDGKVPFSDSDEEDSGRATVGSRGHTQRTGQGAGRTGIKAEFSSDANEKKGEAESAGRRRRRSSSPNASTTNRRRTASGAVKDERTTEPEEEAEETGMGPVATAVDAEHFVSSVSPSPLLAGVDRMPTIRGWAQLRLSEASPYQVQTSKDAETRIKYILDDSDYEWCRRNNICSEVLQKSFTFFEWTYVSFLLNVARGGEGGSASTFSSSALLSAQSGGSRDHRHSASSDGSHANGSSGGGSNSSLNSNTGSGSHGVDANLRNFLAQAKKLNACVCALCAKPVHVITTRDKARLPELQATDSVGVKCADCEVIAHLKCWYLAALPQHPERWVCDGCYLCDQHRRRAAFTRCVVCGRGDGVLLPYRAKDGTTSAFSSSTTVSAGKRETASSSSPAAPSSPTGGSTAESGLCHAACALAFPELTLRLPGPTSLDTYYHTVDSSRNEGATVDLGLRPCVVPVRRIPKQVYNCVYCQHATYPTVQCQHPRCYESMHPSCAAQQHTLECFTLEETSGRHSGGSTTSNDKVVTVERTTATAPSTTVPSKSVTGTTARLRAQAATAPVAATPARQQSHPLKDGRALATASLVSPWTGCSVYCRKHFGYNINRTLGSAAAAEKAEAQSLKMDLHSLLSGLRMHYDAGDREGSVGTTESAAPVSGNSRSTYHRTAAVATRSGSSSSSRNSKSSENSANTIAEMNATSTNEAFFLQGSMPVTKAVRRGPGRPSAAELRQRDVERRVVACVRAYWLQKRAEKRKQSAALAGEINISHTRPILAAALRPELIKIAPAKVRLSHFLCLIPEWQQMLVTLVEGELPLPDEEYDDVQRYRKASAHTRRSGNTTELYQRMVGAGKNLCTFAECCEVVRAQAAARLKLVEAELRWCDALAEWPVE